MTTASGAGLHDVCQLAAAETCGHFRLGQVVGARRAATDFRLRQLVQRQAGYLRQQPARRFADFLRVAQVAGVVIGGDRADFALRRHQSQRVEKLVDVLDLRRQERTRGLGRVVPVVAVVFQHGATARHVDHHRIDFGEREGRDVLVRELPRGSLAPA